MKIRYIHDALMLRPNYQRFEQLVRPHQFAHLNNQSLQWPTDQAKHVKLQAAHTSCSW